MKVFLDTNIVITGALNPFGASSHLKEILDSVRFFTSNKVMQECTFLIEGKTNNSLKKEVTFSFIREFLSKLSTTIVEDEEDPSIFICKDHDDQYIYDSAIKYKCDYICTYNIQDFPTHKIKVNTPYFILREFQTNNVSNYVQAPILSNQGSILFAGELSHKSTMGKILVSSNPNVQVFADANGFIQVIGDNVRNLKCFSPIRGEKAETLSFRYNDGNFEASRWIESSNSWRKQVLTRANCSFSTNTKPELCFTTNNFSGIIRNISGIPTYVKDKKMQSALSNETLEAVTGSLDLQYFLDKITFEKTVQGFRVTVPIQTKNITRFPAKLKGSD